MFNDLNVNKTVRTVTTPQLLTILSEVSEKGHTFGSVIMASEPSGMRKTNNPFYGRVKKLSLWGFGVNTDYVTKVNNQLEREGKDNEFEALPTYAVPLNKIVFQHKDDANRLYMRVFPTANFGQFVDFSVDNRKATPAEIAEIKTFIPEKSTSSRQGTDKKIEVRNILIKNIFRLSLLNETYLIIDNDLKLEI